VPSDGRQLRVREDNIEQHRFVDRLQVLQARRMPRGELRLLDRNVDDLVGAAAVARGVDVTRTRLLPAVGEDPAVWRGLHAGRVETEARGVGLAPECVEQVVARRLSVRPLWEKRTVTPPSPP